MRTGTDRLRRDHERIAAVLRALEALAGRLARGEEVDLRLLVQVQEYLRVFLHGIHRTQEILGLFPPLVDKGLWREREPLATMVQEHPLDDEALAPAAEALEQLRAGAPGAERRWVESARAYVEMAREHIRLEEEVLLPQADRLLSPEEQEALAAELERIEAEALGPGGRARLDRSAEALCNEVLGA